MSFLIFLIPFQFILVCSGATWTLGIYCFVFIIIIRYPTELEKAIESHLGSLRDTEGIPEEGAGQRASEWTMELVVLAFTGMKSLRCQKLLLGCFYVFFSDCEASIGFCQLHIFLHNCYCIMPVYCFPWFMQLAILLVKVVARKKKRRKE